ncbi:MAG: MFS transporter [Francisellaceae bacterium]
MLLKPKKLRLNTRQPIGMWSILAAMLLYSLSLTAVFVSIDSYLFLFSPYTDQTINYNILTNTVLFATCGIIGGIIAHLIGHKRTTILGILYSATGLFLLIMNNLAFIGISVYIVGAGLTIPSLYTSLSFLYTQDDPRRHAGFTLVFMGGILGSFLGITLIETLLQLIGYSQFYALMALITVITALVYLAANVHLSNRQTLLEDSYSSNHKISPYSMLIVLVLISIFIRSLISQPKILTAIALVLCITSLGVLVLSIGIIKEKNQKRRFIALIILMIFSLLFWLVERMSVIIFIQYGNLLTNNQSLFNLNFLPSNFVLQLNTLLVLIIGTISAILWNKNKSRQHIKRITRLIALSLLLSAFSFSCLFATIWFELNDLLFYSTLLLIITVVFGSIAQVLLIPLYYAIVGKLAPRQYESLIMGFFFAIVAGTGVIALKFNDEIITKEFSHHDMIFFKFSYFAICLILFLSAFSLLILARLWQKRTIKSGKIL